MKKNFTNAAEELITGIAAPEMDSIQHTPNETVTASQNGYFKYVEPRSERMNILLSKSLLKKLTAEAKKHKMSKNGLINAILESYFSDSENK